MWKLAEERDDQEQYISRVKEEIATQEKLLSDDMQYDPTTTDHAWDSEEMRQGFSRE